MVRNGCPCPQAPRLLNMNRRGGIFSKTQDKKRHVFAQRRDNIMLFGIMRNTYRIKPRVNSGFEKIRFWWCNSTANPPCVWTQTRAAKVTAGWGDGTVGGSLARSRTQRGSKIPVRNGPGPAAAHRKQARPGGGSGSGRSRSPGSSDNRIPTRNDPAGSARARLASAPATTLPRKGKGARLRTVRKVALPSSWRRLPRASAPRAGRRRRGDRAGGSPPWGRCYLRAPGRRLGEHGARCASELRGECVRQHERSASDDSIKHQAFVLISLVAIEFLVNPRARCYVD